MWSSNIVVVAKKNQKNNLTYCARSRLNKDILVAYCVAIEFPDTIVPSRDRVQSGCHSIFGAVVALTPGWATTVYADPPNTWPETW